jgi:riboflavin biosynthesis pyrimidine reductase
LTSAVLQIFPASACGREIALDDVDALARLYAYPEPGGRPWLRANMIASADGAAALNGRSGGLSGASDRRVFSVLRSLADVILVGAGTARAERYRPVRLNEAWPRLRVGRAPTPPLAVVTAGLNLDPDGPLLAAAPGLARTIVLTTQAAPAERVAAAGRHADVIMAGREMVSPAEAVAALAERGHLRILVEGGPSLLGQFTADGLLDELSLTYSPMLAGGLAGRIIAGPAWAGRAGAAEPVPPQLGLAREAAAELGVLASLELGHVLADEGYLLCSYLRARRGPEIP